MNAFDQAIIDHNWAAAYGLCAPDITRQYGEGGFAATMIQQYQAQGNITAISAPATIILAFTVGGQAYFTVQQQVTHDHGGQTSVSTLTSYYLLDNDAWRFWFSK